MCIVTAGVGATAAAASAATATNVGLAISAISSAAGILQGQQSAAFAQQQANLQLQQQRQQTEVQNQQFANQYASETAAQQAQRSSYEQQLLNNSQAANKAFTQEQVKLDEARTKAAFKAQEIYAKGIGAKGSVLATGASGQSVGLLSLDADRKAGFGLAEQDASVASAAKQAGVAMSSTADQQQTADNNAYSQLKVPVSHPTFSPSPGGGPISAPTYNWFD